MNREFFVRFARNAAISFCLALLGAIILSVVFDREEQHPDQKMDDRVELVQQGIEE